MSAVLDASPDSGIHYPEEGGEDMPKTPAERARERREKLPKGTCIGCTIRPARPGRTKCEQCAEDDKVNAIARKQRMIDQGKCRDCSVRKARPGKATCFACNDARTERRRASAAPKAVRKKAAAPKAKVRRRKAAAGAGPRKKAPARA